MPGDAASDASPGPQAEPVRLTAAASVRGGVAARQFERHWKRDRLLALLLWWHSVAASLGVIALNWCTVKLARVVFWAIDAVYYLLRREEL